MQGQASFDRDDATPMLGDIERWRNHNGLTEDPRRIVKRNLSFFVTADSLATNNIVPGTYRHITAPERCQYLLCQAFEEAIHAHTYQYIVELRGLEAKKIVNAHKRSRPFAMLCVLDENTRECLAIEVGKSLRSQDVILCLVLK